MIGPSEPPLQWLFIDMNSFFASVEQHDRPALRGKPVGVVPVAAENTGFIACSYEAKRLGVGMGMPVWRARAEFPELAIIKARPDRYIKVHHELVKAIDRHAPIDKTYSIDEWAIRLSPAEQPPERAMDLATRIKRQIATDVGEAMRCSAGIAPTQLLAKIACDLKKPDGLTVLNTDQLPQAIGALELFQLPGISQGMVDRLHKHGVKTVTELWQLTRLQARQAWGSVMGEHWWYGLHGVDVPRIKTRKSSVGHSNVLEPKFRNEEAAHGMLVRLLCKAAMRLRYSGYFANVMSVWIRHECGRTWADHILLPCVQDTPTLVQQFEKLWRRRQRMLRALQRVATVGVPKKVAVDLLDLTSAANVSESLFEDLKRPERLSHVMDDINLRLGSHKVYFGSMHHYRHNMDDKIAFGRIPVEPIKM